MAIPAYWQTVPPGESWDPINNNDPLTGDWIQLLEGVEQPGGGKMLTRDDASDTLVGLIPALKQYAAEIGIIGAAYGVGAPDYKMVRINPLPHPNGDEKMRAAAVDMVGWNPFPKDQGSGVLKPFKANPYLPGPNGYDGSPALRLPGYTNHSRLKTTIKFRPVNYPVLEESEMYSDDGYGVLTRLSEVYRNCSFFDEVNPILDVIQATGGGPFLEWADSAASGPPTAGDDIVSEFVEYIQRCSLVAIWHFVPHEFIVAPGEYTPKKIFDLIGYVNDADWYGFPKDTLRFEAPRFRKYVQTAVRAIPSSYEIPFVYDVMLPFSFVRPTMAAISGGGTPFAGGWNAYPFSKTGSYFAVKRITSGTTYFPRGNFDKLFEHVSKP